MGKSWNVWLEDLAAKSPNTRRIYTRYLQRFLDWMKLDAEGLYRLHFDSLRSDDPRDLLTVGRKLSVFLKVLEDEGLAAATQMHAVKAVKSFFKSQGIPPPVMNNGQPKVYYEGQRILEADEIRLMHDSLSDLRNKAILLAAKDSGLRASDLIKFNVGDVKRALDAGEEFTIVRLRQKKTGGPVKVILGPEALTSIREYLDSRRRGGEILEAGAPLFVQVQHEDKGRRLTRQAVSSIFKRLTTKLSLENASLHSTRKFHLTNLQAGGMPEPWISIVQGRRINDSRGPYVQPSDRQLLEAYRRAYPRLAIFGGSQAAEVEELRTRIAELEAERDGLEARLGKRMEGFEKQIEQLRRWRAMSEENKADLVEVEPGTWIDKDLVEGWRKRRRLSAIKKAKA